MFRESPSGTQENEARDSQTDHPLRSAREGAIGRATRDRTSIATDFSRDIGDAVALLPHLARGERVLDVGTGGGVPGVLLAIMRPDLRVELCESVGKRAAQTLLPARASGPGRFDTLVVRAVAPLEKLLGWFEPLREAFGRLLVIKGPRWEEDQMAARLRGLGRKVALRRVASWPLRGTDNESVLLEIRAADRG